MVPNPKQPRLKQTFLLKAPPCLIGQGRSGAPVSATEN